MEKNQLGDSKYFQDEKYRISLSHSFEDKYDFEVADWKSKWNPAWNLNCSYPLKEFGNFIEYVRKRVENPQEIINAPSKQSNLNAEPLKKDDFEILIKSFKNPYNKMSGKKILSHFHS